MERYDRLARSMGYDDEKGSEWRSHVQSNRKSTQTQVVHSLMDGGRTLDEEFRMTYKAARHEAIWLGESLRNFAERALIDDVMALVKGGKEANVYLCRLSAASNAGLAAAKVYRPRSLRNLRNDKMYREGRELIDTKGVAIKQRNNREMRAIANKSSFGQELTHISWLMHEYTTLARLHAAGAAVPRPIAAAENAILMEYVGDKQRPAPVLHGVGLASAEAARLLNEVLRNVGILLSMGLVHGDLSAYNVLYWQGKITLIDFPQVTLTESNSNAWRILRRDVRRVCEYFALQGVDADADRLARQLWDEHVRLPVTDA